MNIYFSCLGVVVRGETYPVIYLYTWIHEKYFDFKLFVHNLSMYSTSIIVKITTPYEYGQLE